MAARGALEFLLRLDSLPRKTSFDDVPLGLNRFSLLAQLA